MPSVAAPKQRPPIPFPSKEATVSQVATHADPNDLVTRCQAGDVDAFETLYRQHSARIYTLACRMGGSVEDGEDLLQEIFLQAYRKIGSFKGTRRSARGCTGWRSTTASTTCAAGRPR